MRLIAHAVRPRALLGTRTRILLLACCAGALPAQTDPNRFVPASAHVVVRTVGPGGWKRVFADTKFARVFTGKTLAPHMKALGELFEKSLETNAAHGMPAEVASAFLTQYHGDIVVSLRFDLEALLGEHPESKFAVMIALGPDGEFSLESLQQGLRKQDESSTEPLVVMQVGDQKFRSAPGPMTVTQVEFVDEHLVMFVGNDVEQLGPAMLAPADRSQRPVSRAPFHVHIDLGSLSSAAAAALARRPVGEGAPRAEPLMRALGLLCMQTFEVTLGSEGDRVTCAMELTTTGKDLGLLGTCFVAQGRPSLLQLVPPGTSFDVGAWDLDAMRRAIEGCFAAGSQAGRSWADIEASFAEATSVRLREDLLDHLGTEVLVLGDMRDLLEIMLESLEDGRPPDPNRMFADYCFGIGLRDGRALAQSLDKMLHKSGLRAAHKTESYRDHEIHTLRLGVVSIEYAITDRVFLCAVGSRGTGVESLRAVLDASKDGATGLPETIAKRLDGLPESWSGVGTMPFVAMLRTFFEMGVTRQRQRGEAIRRANDVVRGMFADLMELGLGEVVSVTYTSPERLRKVYVW